MKFRVGGLLAVVLLTACTRVAAEPVATESSPEPTAPTTEIVSISGSGDLLAHNTLFYQARRADGYDFWPQLKRLQSLLTADINICHLETPLSSDIAQGYPVFSTPVELATAIKRAGFDGCSTASNHTLDQGVEGIRSTLAALKAVGVTAAGTRATKNGSSIGWYETAGGHQVAHLSYAYGFNGFRRPAGQEWIANLIDVKEILKRAKKARAAGADLIVVSMHWGTEYRTEPTSYQTDIAKQLLASSDIDGIIGHHAHVLQPAALVNGKPILYGMGNLWSGQGPWADQPRGQHGAIATLRFEVTEGGAKFVDGSFMPTLTLPSGWFVNDATLVRSKTQKAEACRAITDAAELLGDVLSGPAPCTTD